MNDPYTSSLDPKSVALCALAVIVFFMAICIAVIGYSVGRLEKKQKELDETGNSNP